MKAKDSILEIIDDIKNKGFCFDIDTIINELTTKKIKASRKYITKIIRSLDDCKFDRKTSTWSFTKSNDLPETVKVYMPQIIVYVFNLETKTMESQKLHVLGVFYDEEEAKNHLELQKEFIIRLIESSQKLHPECKISMSVSLSVINAHKTEKGLIFPTEYIQINKEK